MGGEKKKRPGRVAEQRRELVSGLRVKAGPPHVTVSFSQTLLLIPSRSRRTYRTDAAVRWRWSCLSVKVCFVLRVLFCNDFPCSALITWLYDSWVFFILSWVQYCFKSGFPSRLFKRWVLPPPLPRWAMLSGECKCELVATSTRGASIQ